MVLLAMLVELDGRAAGADDPDVLTPEMCRIQSIGSQNKSNFPTACLPADSKRAECSRGDLSYLVELEPSLMPICQPGARVHTRDLSGSTRPRASILELLALLPNATVMMVGDSTMRQLFDAVVCDLLRERLFTCVKGPRWRCRRVWRNLHGAALAFVRAKHPHDPSSWTDFHLTYLHGFPPSEEELWKWLDLGAVDVLLFNFGIHYLLEPPKNRRATSNVSAYVGHMSEMLRRVSRVHARHPALRPVFLQSVAQHFGCKSDYFNSDSPKDTPHRCTGDWDSRDKTRYVLNAQAIATAAGGGSGGGGGAPRLRAGGRGAASRGERPAECACYEFEAPAEGDALVRSMRAQLHGQIGDELQLQLGWRNALAMDLLGRKFARERIGVLRWFEITAPRSQYHRMSCCTSIKSTCDCTHYCYNEVMYHEGFAEWARVLSRLDSAGLQADAGNPERLGT